MKRLVVIPGDPLYKYFDKGEIKLRYWNPHNMFSEVHIISLCSSDIEPEKVQDFVGDARLFIHSIGRPNPTNFLSIRKKALALCVDIKPDLIKGHGALIMGYYASYIGKKLAVPCVVSLHADHSIWRGLRAAGWPTLMRSIYQLAYRMSYMEHYCLRQATVVTCAYNFPTRHARWAGSRNIEIIYNRVDTNRFKPPREKTHNSFRVLTVGNHIPGKEPSAILKAVSLVECELTVVGQGPLSESLRLQSLKLGITHKVTFLPSVPHSELHSIYQQHDVFCISIRYPGVCIPVLEAMSSGLPVIVNQPLWEKTPEFIGTDAVVVENTGKGYGTAIERLYRKPELRKKIGEANRQKVMQVDSTKMEEKEAMLFKKLIG